MDDLWERVDLTKVGVPLPDFKISSKIVFTTRSREICSLMEADRQFKVKCLAEEAAWNLFQTLVGDGTLHDGHPEVLGLARYISKECYGLPLALVRIGRATDGKQTPQEWQDILEVLRRFRSSISGSDDRLKNDIYYHLKSSYDNLQNDLFKICLLYCCLIPRNYRICKRDLIDCWIGEGFLDDRVGAQMQGYYIIDVLLSACLLEEEEDNNYVKMHNWIHDMSLWIISESEKEKRNFFVCTKAGLTGLPEIENWKNVRRMSLVDNSITDLIDAPTYPHLETLFLNLNLFKTINDDFFQFMPCLKVLNLSNNILLRELPSKFSKLVSLQHLDLSRTGIKSLPNQLGDLKKLKCLNLEYTVGLCTIPQGLISKFSVLHVLRLWECGVLNNQSAEDSVACNDAQLLIQELLSLKNLGMLSITLRNSHALQKLLSSYGLQSCTQCLWLQLLRHPKSIVVSLTYLKHLNTLQISKCECLEELEVDFVGESQAIRESCPRFNVLQQVVIDNCSNLRDLTCLVLAPNLKRLEISECCGLEEIIKAGKLSECPELIQNSNPFSKLKILRLSKLPNLKSIYWSVLPFSELKIGTITDCPKLQINLPPCLFNQDEKCESESEEHSTEITSWHELDIPSEPSALKRKAVELNKGSWSLTNSLESGAASDDPARSLKSQSLVWTPQLHKRFVEAVAHLGITNAVPKTILQFMSVDGLTIEDVDSHLQKHRLYLKGMQGLSGGGDAFSNTSAATSASPASDLSIANTPISPHLLSTVEESPSEVQSISSTVTQKVEPSRLTDSLESDSFKFNWSEEAPASANFKREKSMEPVAGTANLKRVKFMEPALTSSPKSKRCVIEEERRKQMRNLFSQLANLILSSQPSKASMPELLDNAISYIKQLEKRVEERKGRLALLKEKCHRNKNITISSPEFNIKTWDSWLEVNLTCGLNKNFMLHEIISVLQEEGADVIDAAQSNVGDRVMYTIRSQAISDKIGIETTRVRERIHDLIF